MLRETKHLTTMVVGALLLFIGLALLLGFIRAPGDEKVVHYTVAGMIGGGAVFIAFGDPRAAVDGIARLLPWGKPRSSSAVPKVTEHHEESDR